MKPANTISATFAWLGAIVLCLVAGVFVWQGINFGPAGLGCFVITALALATAFALLARPVRRQWWGGPVLPCSPSLPFRAPTATANGVSIPMS